MNILFIADIVPYPPNTGIKIRTYNVIKQLWNGGENKIFLLCFNHKKLIPTKDELYRCIAELEKYCTYVRVFEIPSDRNSLFFYGCMAMNILQINPYRAERYYSIDCVKQIASISSDHLIDLVHLDKTEFYRYNSILPSVPVVCTNHNIESELMRLRSKNETSLLRKFFAYMQYMKTKRYEQIVLSKVDGYITCTELDHEYFKNVLHISTKHANIDNGVDVTYYQPVANEQGDYLLIIGAQNKESTANYDATHYFMKSIWSLIQDCLPDIRLKIVGRHPDSSIIEFTKSNRNVEVVGFVEDERPILGNARALIVPLRLGGGSRLKILTAMAMGKPVVSTTIGAEGISCQNGKNILIADAPSDFAKCVVMIMSNEGERQRIGREARILAEEHYCWNRIGVRLREFYRNITQVTDHG